MPFQAMILAAGQGTRLRPLTNSIPKALVKVGSKTMFDHVAQKLFKSGAQRLVVNVHHLGGQIVDHIKQHYSGQPIYISFETESLLETGGGLKKAAHLMIPDLPVLVHNVDVLSDISFTKLAAFHKKNRALATLAVRNRNTKRYFLFNDQWQLRGWTNKETGETKLVHNQPETLHEMAFSGIHFIDPILFELFPDANRFSMVDFYLQVCSQHKIVGFDHTSGQWTDIGKPEQLEEASRLLNHKR